MLDKFLGKVWAVILNPLIEFMFAVAVVLFLYGVFEFMMNQANEEKKTDGRQHMLWGIVGIAVMLGVWAILKFILNTFGITGVTLPA